MPDFPVKGILEALAGLALALMPEDAEGKTYPNFTKLFPKIVSTEGRKELRDLGLLDDDGMMFIGELEEPVLREAKRRYPSVADGKAYMSRHSVDQHSYEMSPEDMAQAIEWLMNSERTRVIPNFPSRNHWSQTHNSAFMLANKDNNGKQMVIPFMTDKDGHIVLKTAFEPYGSYKRGYVDKWLGGPLLSSIFLDSEQFTPQRDAQPPGLSVVSHLPDPKLPVNQQTVNGGFLGALARGDVPEEPGLEEPLWSPIDFLAGLPVKGAAMGAKVLGGLAEPFVNIALDKAAGAAGNAVTANAERLSRDIPDDPLNMSLLEYLARMPAPGGI